MSVTFSPFCRRAQLGSKNLSSTAWIFCSIWNYNQTCFRALFIDLSSYDDDFSTTQMMSSGVFLVGALWNDTRLLKWLFVDFSELFRLKWPIKVHEWTSGGSVVSVFFSYFHDWALSTIFCGMVFHKGTTLWKRLFYKSSCFVNAAYTR